MSRPVYCSGRSTTRLYRRRLVLAIFLLAFSAFAFSQGPEVVGQWSSLQSWPCNSSGWVPTHAMLLPNGKVFYLSSYNDGALPRIWDPATNGVTTTATPGYNLFCAGHSMMADGKLFITGGHIDNFIGFAPVEHRHEITAQR